MKSPINIIAPLMRETDPSLRPTGPSPADLGEARPRFAHRDPDDVVTINPLVSGGAARVAHDLTAEEKQRPTHFSTVCTIGRDDIELRSARHAHRGTGIRARGQRGEWKPIGQTLAVLTCLRQRGPLACSQIAFHAGLPSTRVPDVVDQLCVKGYARPTGRTLTGEGPGRAPMVYEAVDRPAAQEVTAA